MAPDSGGTCSRSRSRSSCPITWWRCCSAIVFTFTDMIVVFVLTRGGPYDTTQVLASWAYFTGIQGGDLAGGAAISLFLFPVLVAVAIVFLRVRPPHGGDLMTPLRSRATQSAAAGGHAAVLVFFVTFLAFPFYWMLITTFKTTQDLLQHGQQPVSVQ